jgi:hypothetical protein
MDELTFRGLELYKIKVKKNSALGGVAKVLYGNENSKHRIKNQLLDQYRNYDLMKYWALQFPKKED